MSTFEMSSLGLVQYSNARAGSRLQLMADLALKQRDLLSHKGIDVRYNVSMESGAGLILGLRPANERRRYKVTPSLIGWAQT